ncbi:SpoIIE family protein phosphatase [Dehalococcoidia bacterium]|nr:SpoIIE family protein phosphatase [Dehalococcoidia bacterium]
MRQIVKVARNSLNKHGEELCGDWVKVTMTPDTLIVVLSDGLGSGVKANILATLTAEIAASMLEQGSSVEEVIETLATTLPECQVRRLAYATFAVLQVFHGSEAYLVEYDSPPLILIRDDEVVDLPVTERVIAGRTIRENRFALKDGDYMVMVSDGYIHAGVGGLYRMGWGWKNVALAVRRWVATRGDAYQLTHALSETCLKLYNGTPGDDATIIGMWVRQARAATILTGPPSDPKLDGLAVSKLMSSDGIKVICGGTTAQMAARELGQKLVVEWQAPGQHSRSSPSKIPPIARLEGVDLVSEGVLTLSTAAERLRTAETIHDLPAAQDAGTRLARILLEADDIHFIVGDAINPQQLADVVRGKPMRQIYLEEVIEQLKRRNKLISIEHL